MRKISNIEVQVLDLSDLCEEAFEIFTTVYHNQTGDFSDVIGCVTNGEWGKIETENGIYVLNSFGEGINHPIGNLNIGLSIAFYPAFENVYPLSIAICDVGITLPLIHSLEVSRTVPLNEFILKFNMNQEVLYQGWDTLFNSIIEILTKETLTKEERVTTKEALTKYIPFIQPTVCKCDKKEVLIEVTAKICSCGQNRGHKHCKNCGGVI